MSASILQSIAIILVAVACLLNTISIRSIHHQISLNGEANRESRRRKAEYRALIDALRVGPIDLEDSGANIVDHYKDRVAWSALVERGVRASLELRVSGDGDLYVESFGVADVVNDRDSGSESDVFDGPDDIPVSGKLLLGGPFSEVSSEFVEADGCTSGNDCDQDASPHVHHDPEPIGWDSVMGGIMLLNRKEHVRLTLLSEAA